MSDRALELELLRQQIDALDLELLRLLNARAAVVLQIQALKRRLDLPARSAEREKEILRRLQRANPGPLPDEAVEEVFRTVLRQSIAWLVPQQPPERDIPPGPPPTPGAQSQSGKGSGA